MTRTTPPAAPALEDLPPCRSPSTGARSDFAVPLAIVTPTSDDEAAAPIGSCSAGRVGLSGVRPDFGHHVRQPDDG
jgi:hypothetical protein